jgi:hypothetical protein
MIMGFLACWNIALCHEISVFHTHRRPLSNPGAGALAGGCVVSADLVGDCGDVDWGGCVHGD